MLFFRAVSHQLYLNPNDHYLFVPQKSSRFFTAFVYRNKLCKTLFSNDTKTIKYPPPPQILVVNKPLSDCITSPKTILPFRFSPEPNCPTRNQTTTNQTTSIQVTRNCSKEDISHSYYPTLIKASLQHLSIRPLEQTVKFVCCSLSVTNPKNPKAFILHPQANKLFQTYQNSLIFRLQVLSVPFKISDNPCTFA